MAVTLRAMPDDAMAGWQLAEAFAAEHGATKLGLNVFGTNTVAQAQYTSLDYTTTAITMWKPLTP